MSLRSFSGQIELNAPIEKVFHYCADTDQMAKLLPPSLCFKILQRSTRHLSQGVTLEFEVRLFKIPFRRKLHVHSFSQGRHIACVGQPSSFFTCERDYYFESLPNNQTRVTDCVLYRLPLGPVGLLLDRLWVRSLFQRAFEHHRAVLQSIFQPVRRVSSLNSKPNGPPSDKIPQSR